MSLRFANKEDRDHVVNAARSVGWSPVDVDVEQTDWQDEGMVVTCLPVCWLLKQDF